MIKVSKLFWHTVGGGLESLTSCYTPAEGGDVNVILRCQDLHYHIVLALQSSLSGNHPASALQFKTHLIVLLSLDTTL